MKKVVADGKWEIETWAIEKAQEKAWKDNPKQIASNELSNLRRLIATFGMVLPIIYNKQVDSLVGGHQRLKAAALEGLTEVPVRVVDLTLEDHRRLALALSKIEGDWDYEKLASYIEDLAGHEAQALTGFDETELVSIFANYEESGEGEPNFDSFVEMGNSAVQSQLVPFRSPKVEFICTRDQYNALLVRIQKEVGTNDRDCSDRFFRMIEVA
jgi:ParB-like chromosome segregation protein Spo0J